jgi:hypothetical protein
LEASTGFEPVNKDFADPRLTTWPRRHGNNKDCKLDILSICNPIFVERAMRFELTTFSLARRRSTTELRPHFLTHVQVESAETQDRTGDTAIFSRVLYQLSYLGQSILLLSVRDFTRTYMDCQERLLIRRNCPQVVLTFFNRVDIMLGRCLNETVQIVYPKPHRVRREEWHLLYHARVTHVFP